MAKENPNNLIQDEVIDRQIDIVKLGEGGAKQAIETVDKSEAELITAITLALVNITDAPTKANFNKLAQLQRKVGSIRSKAFQEAMNDNLEDMLELGQDESDWIAEITLAIAGLILLTLTDNQVRKIVTLIPFAGKTHEQWWAQAYVNDVNRIMTAIRAGIQNGLSVDQIVEAVQGTKTVAGVLESTRNEIRTAVKTIATGVSNESQVATAKKGEGYNRVQWVSVLDSRTSAICRGLSGQIWRIDEAHPTPPAHPNCRSSLTYLLTGEPPADEITYDQWLRKQPVKRQKEILPVWQFKEFKKGAPLTTFVSKDITPLTMKEFKARKK